MKHAIAALALTACAPVHAHDAETGWPYSTFCCSGQDCTHVEPGVVTITPEGYRVQIGPGDHPLATREYDQTFPPDHFRIQQSGDEDFHVCLWQGKIRCVYVPVMGF